MERNKHLRKGSALILARSSRTLTSTGAPAGPASSKRGVREAAERWLRLTIAVALLAPPIAFMTARAARSEPVADAWVAQAAGPPAQAGTAMADFPPTGSVVLFGGFTEGPGTAVKTSTFHSETWVYSGEWALRDPGGPLSPPPVAHPYLAYDAARRNIVLVGGGGRLGPIASEEYMTDTWIFNGLTWTKAGPAPAHNGLVRPITRASGAIAYDAKRQKVVLFNGEDRGGIDPTGTWTWDGQAWTEMPGMSPAANGESPEMAYDPISERIILLIRTSGTWAWDGERWAHVANSPVGRNEAPTMASFAGHDPGLGTPKSEPARILLFSGMPRTVDGYEGVPGDADLDGKTWTWEGDRWALRSPAVSPAPRLEANMAFQWPTRQYVLYGGLSSNAPRSDTWTYRLDGLPDIPAGPGDVISQIPQVAQPPRITDVTPESGPGAGGTRVSITGSGFKSLIALAFGDAPVASTPCPTTQITQPCYSVNPAGTGITAYSPPHSAGKVDIRALGPAGPSDNTPADDFTYENSAPLAPQPPVVSEVAPRSGPLAGGTEVTISGSHLSGATKVSFGTVGVSRECGGGPGDGANPCFKVQSEERILAYSPRRDSPVRVHITVETPDGISLKTEADIFTYLRPDDQSVPQRSNNGVGGAANSGSGGRLTPSTPGGSTSSSASHVTAGSPVSSAVSSGALAGQAAASGAGVAQPWGAGQGQLSPAAGGVSVKEESAKGAAASARVNMLGLEHELGAPILAGAGFLLLAAAGCFARKRPLRPMPDPAPAVQAAWARP